ncbi:aminotransferase class I/II-fold pyridoxal phosphate-dependent enzyme [Aquimarina aquimarini]|uniref:aminotransferase class I/II-fold pyridoxal phosphate-dependent enzyme n=1 Tax=Aquimarina aquimarini TaxID=1191734 RepID=UPI000D560868|nr:aminotransferase class I/II-fold pyridoxal phosphate-dependent enzyme [Aquimarina aquimarini]
MENITTMTIEKKRKLLKSLLLHELKKVNLSENKEDETSEPTNTYSIQKISDTLAQRLSELLKIPKNEIAYNEDLKIYGLDSMGMLGVLEKMKNEFPIEIEVSEIVTLKTIEEISQFIISNLKINNDEVKNDSNKESNTTTISSNNNISKKEEFLSFHSFENVTDREDIEIESFNNFAKQSYPEPVTRSCATGPVIVSKDGTEVINFNNYDYLGYASHPEVINSSKLALDKYGLGATASPLVGGRLGVHNELENELHAFFNKKDSGISLFATGYNAVFGSISAYMGKGDHIVMDAYSHACIVDGAANSKASLHYYMHNDIEDLERILQKLDNGENRILVCTEGVFSADGDYGNIKEIVQVSKKHGAKILVDEAHSFLLTGDQGRGVCFSQGVLEEVDMIVGTFSKTFSGIGGFLLAKKSISEYINVYARNRMFSCALPPSITAGMLKAFQLAISKDGDERRKKLMTNATILKSLCENKLKLAPTKTWIVPVIFGDEIEIFKIADYLKENGIQAPILCYPAAPRGFARIRHFVTSEHTPEQLQKTAKVLIEAGKKFGYIS